MARSNAWGLATALELNSDLAIGLSPTWMEAQGSDKATPALLRKAVADRDAANAALIREREYIVHLEAQVVGWTRKDEAISAATAAADAAPKAKVKAPKVRTTPVNVAAPKDLTSNVVTRLTNAANRQGWTPESVIAAIEALPTGDRYEGTGAVYNIDRDRPLTEKQADLWNDHIADRIVLVEV